VLSVKLSTSCWYSYLVGATANLFIRRNWYISTKYVRVRVQKYSSTYSKVLEVLEYAQLPTLLSSIAISFRMHSPVILAVRNAQVAMIIDYLLTFDMKLLCIYILHRYGLKNMLSVASHQLQVTHSSPNPVPGHFILFRHYLLIAHHSSLIELLPLMVLTYQRTNS
jgi:hypothetical protein